MDVSICAYFCACIHLYILVICKYIHTHVCIYACMNIFMCVHFCVCIYICLSNIPKAGVNNIPNAEVNYISKAGVNNIPKAGVDVIPKAGMKRLIRRARFTTYDSGK